MVPKVAISAVSLIVLLCTYGWDHYRLLLAMQKGQSKHRFAWISAILEWDINTTDSTSIFPEPLNSLKTGGKCCMCRYERLEPKMCPDCMKPAGSRCSAWMCSENMKILPKNVKIWPLGYNGEGKKGKKRLIDLCSFCAALACTKYVNVWWCH